MKHTPYATRLQGNADKTGTVKRKHQNRESCQSTLGADDAFGLRLDISNMEREYLPSLYLSLASRHPLCH